MSERAFCKGVAGAVADYLWQELKLHPCRGDYRVISATSGPRILTLGLVINPRHAARVMGLAEQLSMAAGLDRDSSIRATRGNRGTLALEIPKPDSLWYNIGVRALPRRRGLKAPVGIDVEHRPALVDFSNPLTPHLLAAGTTGSGKTNTARLFVYDLASGNSPDEVRLILMDTRKRGAAWRPFAALPHLAHPVITDGEEALRALGWAVAEMDRRAVDGRSHPHVFVSIDEAQALLDRDEFVRPISDLAAVGREFGVHLLLATQNPTAEMLGTTSIKRNLTTRLVGKVDSAQAASVATGVKETGAGLCAGAVDQLLVQPAGIKRITAALVTEKDAASLPRTEAIGSLDLSEYEDIDRVCDQAATTQAAPLDAHHVAVALASRRGITWLAGELGIGSKRAQRVKAFADTLILELEELGYTLIPQKPDMRSANVTESEKELVV